MQVIEREREIAAMEASHKAAVSLLEEQLLNAESRLARESEQCRHLEHRFVPFLPNSALKEACTVAASCFDTLLKSLICLPHLIMKEMIL